MKQLDVAAYQTAEKLMRQYRSDLVHHDRVRPVWIGDGGRFWYRVNAAGGQRFVLADPAAGTRVAAFDHDRLASALAAAAGREVDPATLPFPAIDLTGDAVEFDAFDEHWRCSLDTYVCERTPRKPTRGVLEVASPDGTHTVYTRDNNIWLRTLEDGTERVLTTDGVVDHDYGTGPDWLHYSTVIRKLGLPSMPAVAAWSPDSTRVLTHRTDQRGVRTTHLVDPRPDDGGPPVWHVQRNAFPGDEKLTMAELVVLDVRTGDVVAAQADPLPMSLMSPVTTASAWWSADSSAVYFLGQPRDQRTIQLNRLDPATGEVTAILTESGPTRLEANQFTGGENLQYPLVKVLSGGAEVIWFSQRDGWGHLYLYDANTGEPRRQLTSGEFLVRDILRVDEKRRLVYLTVCGLVAEDPLRRSICRVSLDDGGLTRLVDDDLDHAVVVAPNRAYFLDTASTTQHLPVVTARDWGGNVLVELERADITRLTALGWTPPEHFWVKGADGQTDIHGVLYKPHGFDPRESYPVVDHVYPGPQTNRVGPVFHDVFSSAAESVAALGFVVVAIDGRGTPGRSKAFHDASYGNLADGGGLADHVTAIRQLAATRPWMDLDRVGVFGESAGGQAALRAILDYGDFYRVCSANCGSHDIRSCFAQWAEAYEGPAGETDYGMAANENVTHKLQGKLQLIHGGMDTNVNIVNTMRVVDSLIAADKDFDLVVIPRAEHTYFGYDHYLFQRRWDFLVRELMGAQPPNYRVKPVPLGAGPFADWF
ncbi:S9 family peptidase [Actinosynnema sp. ALI-1.44]|uniref:S9 family peptidase n=1 Tax=Actinosynnema sp. ALI-1.44 TaxID=1933779 RepID=UPI00097C2963|nr:DPP IV N-terminal domain-containing protein [Actinosynnema sp. ALI-1.44]ONI88292.1 S9 family peptidase [Actinosynnema sp. ALI-1.44]